MKRLIFNNLSSKSNGLLVILGIICFFIGSIDVFSESNSVWNKRLFALGFLLQSIFFIRMFLGKYYMGWNKAGATIRVDSLLGKSFNFKDVKSTNISNDILHIEKRDGTKITIDLSKINSEDVEKLTEIIQEHTVMNNLNQK